MASVPISHNTKIICIMAKDAFFDDLSMGGNSTVGSVSTSVSVYASFLHIDGILT